MMRTLAALSLIGLLGLACAGPCEADDDGWMSLSNADDPGPARGRPEEA